MSPDLEARLETLRARLARRPYDAPALCEELVLLAALGKLDAARAAFDERLPFLGASAATAVLDDLASGRAVLHASGQAYWLDAPPPPELVSRAEALLLATGQVLGELPPRVIFRVEPIRPLAPHAVRVVNGFGLVVLHADPSGLASGAGPLLAHEIAHTALACGHPFLDEGLATWFERREQGRDPLAAEPDLELPPLASLLRPDVDRLLCRTPSERYVQRVYDQGARMFAWLMTQRPEVPLAPFFLRAILGRSRGNLPHELERYFSVRLGELERALSKRR